MKAKEVFLLLLIIAVGSGIYFYQTSGWRGWLALDGWNDGWTVFGGHSYNYETSRTIAGPVPGRVEIDNAHGWVELRGEEGRTDIQVVLKKRVWRRKEDEARMTADGIRMIETRNGDALVLSTNREDFRKKNFETSFVVLVPIGTKMVIRNSYGSVQAGSVAELTVENRHGRISAHDIPGPWKLGTSYEDLEARRMGKDGSAVNSHADIVISSAAGDVRAECTYGRVYLEKIEGKVTVNGRHSAVDLKDVAGTADVDSTFENIKVVGAGRTRITAEHAAVTARDIHGDLTVATSYEPIQVSGVDGGLSIDGRNSAVSVDGVAGRSVTVSTTHEPVNISGFSGRLQVDLRHGDLVLKPKDITDSIIVNGEYCGIELYWPPETAVRFEGQTRGGDIDWGLRTEPDSRKTNGSSEVKAFGRSSGQAEVRLSTTYGNIKLIEGSRSF